MAWNAFGYDATGFQNALAVFAGQQKRGRHVYDTPFSQNHRRDLATIGYQSLRGSAQFSIGCGHVLYRAHAQAPSL